MNRDDIFVGDEINVKRVWEELFRNLHNSGRNKDAIVNACVYVSVKRNRYFWGGDNRQTEKVEE